MTHTPHEPDRPQLDPAGMLCALNRIRRGLAFVTIWTRSISNPRQLDSLPFGIRMVEQHGVGELYEIVDGPARCLHLAVIRDTDRGVEAGYVFADARPNAARVTGAHQAATMERDLRHAYPEARAHTHPRQAQGFMPG